MQRSGAATASSLTTRVGDGQLGEGPAAPEASISSTVRADAARPAFGAAPIQSSTAVLRRRRRLCRRTPSTVLATARVSCGLFGQQVLDQAAHGQPLEVVGRRQHARRRAQAVEVEGRARPGDRGARPWPAPASSTALARSPMSAVAISGPQHGDGARPAPRGAPGSTKASARRVHGAPARSGDRIAGACLAQGVGGRAVGGRSGRAPSRLAAPPAAPARRSGGAGRVAISLIERHLGLGRDLQVQRRRPRPRPRRGGTPAAPPRRR